MNDKIVILKALAALKGNFEWGVVLDFLKTNLDAAMRRNANERDDVSCRWTQGMIQWLSEFVDMAECPVEKINALESFKRNQLDMELVQKLI